MTLRHGRPRRVNIFPLSADQKPLQELNTWITTFNRNSTGLNKTQKPREGWKANWNQIIHKEETQTNLGCPCWWKKRGTLKQLKLTNVSSWINTCKLSLLVEIKRKEKTFNKAMPEYPAVGKLASLLMTSAGRILLSGLNGRRVLKSMAIISDLEMKSAGGIPGTLRFYYWHGCFWKYTIGIYLLTP